MASPAPLSDSTGSPTWAGPPQRVAVVTGAARGVGAATTRALHAAGTAVVAFDLAVADSTARVAGVDYPLGSAAELKALSDELGPNVVAVRGDVRDARALQQAVDLALDRWGRLDVAVACAAVISGSPPAWQAPPDPLGGRAMWQTNVDGVRHLAQAAIPAMLAGPDPSGARFVAVASSAALTGMFGLTEYAMTKHAALGYLRSLAADLVGTGISAVAVAPGAIDTAMGRAAARFYGVELAELGMAHPLRRLLTPEEVAAAVAWCCGLQAAPLTGTVLRLDGS